MRRQTPLEALQQTILEQCFEPLYLGLQCLRLAPGHRFSKSQIDHLRPRDVKLRGQFLIPRVGPDCSGVMHPILVRGHRRENPVRLAVKL
jgi:hypothetical protein